MTAQRETATDWVPEDSFGARLALIRQHLGGWNVARTARACGIDDQTWRNWEAGGTVRDYEAVCRKIAARVGCSRVWLAAGGPLQNRKKMMGFDLHVITGEATTPTPPTGDLRPVR